METQQAKALIADTFTRPFDPDRFKLFIANLLNKFDDSKERGWSSGQIYKDFQDHIAAYKRVGVYTAPDGEEIELLIVRTRHLSKLEQARTSLRNYVVKWLQSTDNKERARDYALVAFYAKEDDGADWRFSFIKIENEAYLDEKAKVRNRTLLPPAKRFSFLVGEHENSYTARKQLLPLLERDYANPTLQAIEEAFSVEKVTDEFFQQYKDLYLKLSEHLSTQPLVAATLAQANLDVTRFTKKLLGQIVFLYFVQKKGWLGVPPDGKWGAGKRNFLRTLFDQTHSRDQNFYAEVLQYLFYEALAQARADAYYPRFGCKIPFLNGGLFESDYDWQNQHLTLPNDLFSNDERNKAGDVGTGILDVFDRYNFTIKEDEPLEKEVAVDPEMLGKVFENMLEVEERKSKGAFYTPREIVHYMCQESLIHYLDNALNDVAPTYREFGSAQTSFFGNENQRGQLTFTEEQPTARVPRDALEILIRHGSRMWENDQQVLQIGNETGTYQFQLPESIRAHAAVLDEKLATIKICDPAIGSGAFPVGLLHEVVNARLILQSFTAKHESIYTLKRHAIQESIYGVDIDPSAIDVARLRLWLSLIVDEDDFERIDALPNLDYKIVQGNSLIGFPEKWDTPRTRELEALKAQFFAATEQEKKRELKAEIDTKIEQRLADSKKIFGYPINFDFRLFFSEVWRQQGGFDVVIGNPPYVQIQKFSGQQIQKDWEKQQYETFAKTGDIYCLFYEKGNRLLRDRGVLTFITSNKWMRAAYGQPLRQFFLKYTAIEQIIDFGDSPIFSEATTYTNILLFQKATKPNQPRSWDLSTAYRKATSLVKMLEENPAGTPVFTDEAFIIVPPEFAAIKQRIEQVGTALKEWDIGIYRGILTGFNEAFIIDGKKKNELIARDQRSAEIIKPILRGRDIKRYRVDFADLWLIDTHNGHDDKPPIDITAYPAVKAHLDQHWDNLKKRQDKGKTPYNLRNCAYHEKFEKEKIVYAEIVYDSAFFLDTTGFYSEATAFTLTGQNIKYLTALLNSRLLTFAFMKFYAGGDLRGNTFRYKKVFLENLPVIEPQQSYQRLFEILMDYMQIVKKFNIKLHSAYFEQLIDGMVYELYFPDKLKAAKKEILAHMSDLTPINDDMSDEAKLAIIQRKFERLYDPSHPVRNHLETLDSVEEVRIIQESLR